MSSDSYPGIRCIDDLFTGWRCPRQLAERLRKREEEYPGEAWHQASPGVFLEEPSGAGSTHQFLEKTRVLTEFRTALHERYPGIVEMYPGPYQDLLESAAGGSQDPDPASDRRLDRLETRTLEALSNLQNIPERHPLDGVGLNQESSVTPVTGILNGVLICQGRILFLDLIRPGDYGGLNISLLKAASKVKDGYVREAAWLAQGLEAAGYQVDEVNILYLNKNYPRNSNELFNSQRQKKGHKFMKADISQEIRRVEAKLGLAPYRLEAIPGCKRSSCPYCAHENPSPLPGDISRLHRSGGLATKLRAQGINRVQELHLVQPPLKQKIKPYHWIQHRAEVEGEEQLNSAALTDFFSGLQWPLYFLDFECYLEALPRWNAVGIWEHVPFLYSVYRMDEPDTPHSASRDDNRDDASRDDNRDDASRDDNRDDASRDDNRENDSRDDNRENDNRDNGQNSGSPRKVGSFLIEPGADKRGELVDALIRDLGDQGSILVYGIHFEKAVLRRLAALPDSRREELEAIIRRLVDLQKPFGDFSFYHPGQDGKISLKTVLPVLTNHGYEDDKVSSGSDAFIGYYYLMHPELPVPTDWDSYAQYVRENPGRFYREVESYCDTDTYGLAYVVNALLRRVIVG